MSERMAESIQPAASFEGVMWESWKEGDEKKGTCFLCINICNVEYIYLMIIIFNIILLIFICKNTL